jgi:hypothetical protein
MMEFEEMDAAAKYFTISNFASSSSYKNKKFPTSIQEIQDVYRVVEDAHYSSGVNSIRAEYQTWYNDLLRGDSYCHQEWKKAKKKFKGGKR